MTVVEIERKLESVEIPRLHRIAHKLAPKRAAANMVRGRYSRAAEWTVTMNLAAMLVTKKIDALLQQG